MLPYRLDIHIRNLHNLAEPIVQQRLYFSGAGAVSADDDVGIVDR